ncbi:MAG TPA: ATP-binding protein, partial [Cytophagaceae bacterium]
MEIMNAKNNKLSLAKEIAWFESLIHACMDKYFNGETFNVADASLQPPDLSSDHSNYSYIIDYYKFGYKERIILMLALIPHIKPHVLDVFFTRNNSYDKTFTEFGGVKGNNHTGFLPTVETAAFLIAGNNLDNRFNLLSLLHEKNYLRKHNIIVLDSSGENEPFFSRPLRISKEYLAFLTTGNQYKPEFSSSFPASLLTTQFTWSDLV